MKNQAKSLRIGGASAFWGDSAMGIAQLVESGEVDVLVFDYLAELTMSLLARARVKDPLAGYASDFVSDVAPHLQKISERGIKLLSNAGGMNPRGCAQALEAATRKAGVTLNIVVVEGDDLFHAQDTVRAAGVTEMFSGAPFPERVTSMNAYLGAGAVAAALKGGADVVITGRCVDSGLALGALVHHFDWALSDYDCLAAGTLVGHLLECTTQTTGGLFTDWLDINMAEEIGYPIAVCEQDGTFVLCKPPGTGGSVAPLVAAEQMIYEIGDPTAYLMPDVRCDFTGVTITLEGEDRVRITGARGSAPSDCYKVSATWHDGYRISSTLTIVGDRAVEKARKVAESILVRTRRQFASRNLPDYDDTEIEVLGSEEPSYGANARGLASREVVLRLTCRHASAEALKILAREFAPFGTAGAPGTTGFSGRPKPTPVFRLFSFLWPKKNFPIQLVALDGKEMDLGAQQVQPLIEQPQPQVFETGGVAIGPRKRVPLSRIAVARSGDKGDTVNIAVIARRAEFIPAIADALTPAAVGAWFKHSVRGEVVRYDIPGVNAFNFVLRSALAGGGAASLRNDPLGKTFGQVLLALELDVPEELID